MDGKNDMYGLNKENTDPQGEIAELKESLENLEETISTTNSTKRVLWRGVITGLSGAIGATIIFGILLTFTSGILYATGIFPDLNEFLSNIIKK